MGNRVEFLWRNAEITQRYSTAVCLHGHTLHSEECLSFLPRYLGMVPGLAHLARGYERAGADFARAYWTPPLTPASALALEREQIVKLGLRPIVSLTDHDNLEAGMALQVTADRRRVPISVEWTVPYRRTIFHLGIHNLPPQTARGWLEAMADFTASPDERLLPPLLRALAAIPDALIVLNHPYWLEEGVVEEDHPPALRHLLGECLPFLHAFELNGTRPWRENADTIGLAHDHSRPVISGGDRHACEPAACLNLTNAKSFSEFAAEVRAFESHVLFLPQYRESMAMRVLEATWDILRNYPEYPGRERWTDRVFYRGKDGAARPLSQVWEQGAPWMVRGAMGILELVATTKLRQALRMLLMRRGEVLP
ncbi:MAG TPA: hypothetical protein VML19_26195 [Verrucomicrobiae bacterium]|nr:hypothetical protein [Verrucomicrobiae bacterium]